MTTGHGSNSNSRKTIRSLGIIVAGMLIFVVAGGGVVWMRPEGSSYTTTTTAVKGLVFSRHNCAGDDFCNSPCIPATNDFGGLSQTNKLFAKMILSKPVTNWGTRPNTAGRIRTTMMAAIGFTRADGSNVVRLGMVGMPLHREICATSIPLRKTEIPIHAGCPSAVSAAYRVKM